MRKISGFTLIELLVVVAIIGGLSALLFPNFMAARERARDTQRKSDIHQIEKALELYKQDQSPVAYPLVFYAVGSTWSSGGVVYMNSVPGDPNRTPSDYYYWVDNTNLTYKLCACLENIADKDGVAGNCDNSTYTCAAGQKKYQIQP